MKRTINFTFLFLLLLLAILFFSGCKVSISENAEMMIRGAEFYYEPLSDEEANTIREIFDEKETFFDNGLSCPFFDEIAIKIGNDVFMPACDKCGIVRINNSYNIYISDKERNALEKVFNNHSQDFPYL